LDPNFQAYVIFRAESAAVDSLSRLVGTIGSVSTLSQQDADVVEGKTYYYRVYVRNIQGIETGSNTLQAQVENVRPPTPVTLQTPTSVGVTDIGLEWSQSGDRDFGSYRVYRNETGAVTDNDQLVSEITDVGRTYCDDAGLQESTTYYYRVYTVDQGGLRARSNEVQATTKEPELPDAVSLLVPIVAVPPDPASVTLNWSRSQDGTFAAYRIFRAESLPVDTLSRLVSTVESVSTLSYQDLSVVEGKTYYYRVYVLNNAGRESGSNTVQAFVENVRPPTAVTLQTPSAIGTTRIGLDWSRSTDLDFGSYRIFRNTTGDVTDTDLLIADVSDINRLFYDDSGLQPNTTYYYRVYSIDQGGLKSRSNEVSATTKP
jgi:fibronectin type 3 domain-containing protein